jgi:hypothetical protein
MSPRLLALIGVAMAILGVAGWFSYTATSDMRLQLTGEVLKVRSLALTPESTLILLDYRVKNDSDVTFILKEDTIFWTGEDGKEREATHVTRPDVDRILQHLHEAGPKYNEMLVMREKVTGKAMLDRMSAGVIQVPDAEFSKRKSVKLRLIDLDGQTFEFLERKKAQ